MSRRQDIDQIRGLAILLMIMVHAAATWAPADASTTSLLALIVASLGGLAAPLFVTVGGWVTVQSTWTLRKAMIRFVFLMIAQFLVNITASHLFDPFTPGVLSLFAILYLTAPIWIRIARNSITFGATLVLIGIINTVFSPGDVSLSWNDRVEVSGISQLLSHLLVTGTYPLFPWMFFSILGAGINIHAPGIQKLGLAIVVGLLVCVSFLYESLHSGIPFAQPRGDAILTFFPANTPFLIGACTGSDHMATPREPPTITWIASFRSAISHTVPCPLCPNLFGIGCEPGVVLSCTCCDCIHVGMVAFERVLENTVSNILARVCVTTVISP